MAQICALRPGRSLWKRFVHPPPVRAADIVAVKPSAETGSFSALIVCDASMQSSLSLYMNIL